MFWCHSGYSDRWYMSQPPATPTQMCTDAHARVRTHASAAFLPSPDLAPSHAQLRTEYFILKDSTCTYSAPHDCIVKFNHRHRSVCRVTYSPPLWQKLFSVYKKLANSDRLGICIDVVTLCLESYCTGVLLSGFLMGSICTSCIHTKN